MDGPWEDCLLERKAENDLKDLLATMVAFANSVAPEHTAVILIGERDDGTVQGVSNPDSIQKTVRKEAERIYPDVVWRSTVYEKDHKQCVRVEIEYSGETPHFGGPAWVRRGSETVKATDEIFQRLIDTRSSKVRALAKSQGKFVSLTLIRESGTFNRQVRQFGLLIDVNRFFVTIQRNEKNESYPLVSLLISWDHDNNRVELISNQDKRPFPGTADD